MKNARMFSFGSTAFISATEFPQAGWANNALVNIPVPELTQLHLVYHDQKSFVGYMIGSPLDKMVLPDHIAEGHL